MSVVNNRCHKIHCVTDPTEAFPNNMNNARYEALPSEPGPYASFTQDVEEDAPTLPAYDSDPRFKMATPSPLTRAGLLFLIAFLFWWAVHLRKGIWIASGMGMEKQEFEEVDLSY